jgi:hypothetical protein
MPVAVSTHVSIKLTPQGCLYQPADVTTPRSEEKGETCNIRRETHVQIVFGFFGNSVVNIYSFAISERHIDYRPGGIRYIEALPYLRELFADPNARNSPNPPIFESL